MKIISLMTRITYEFTKSIEKPSKTEMVLLSGHLQVEISEPFLTQILRTF